MISNFVKKAVDAGGSIYPLIIPSELTNGTGLFNPSVLVLNEKIIVNIRHCQYTLYHAELNKHEHQYGPLVYLNPENDITLTTTNYISELHENLNMTYFSKVDTSKLDVPPLWEFVGLEDGRLVYWNDKFYLCGVRRDTTTNGQGRMELSELEFSDNEVKEISRFRIPAPGNDSSYCEKNWMPVLDQPFTFVKWTNPTEVVYADVKNKTCTTTHIGKAIIREKDLRGGSQVIPFEEGYLALNHETTLYTSEAGRKDATYRHRFTYWDKNWNILKISKEFAFMNCKIEFACGMAEYKDDILITFGVQDNSSFILKTPKQIIEEVFND
jgi:predicted GH43/DUF377 family glycosyl hydrolase